MSGRGEAGALRFAGYAAIFDRVDRGGEVVRPGARRRRCWRPRELLALELVEVSLVTHPMQPLARVIGVEGRNNI